MKDYLGETEIDVATHPTKTKTKPWSYGFRLNYKLS